MRAHELRVGRVYAAPTNPGPWYRYAVPARVMARATRGRVLVLLPDGMPAGPARAELPRSALVRVPATSLVCAWDEWPAVAASTRADMTLVVASAVAAIAGGSPPPARVRRPGQDPSPWWSRPVGELLRPPARPHDEPGPQDAHDG